MSAPSKREVILQPPRPGMHQDINEFYKFSYEIWERTGGYTPAVTNLKGLEASVKELNTLVGIRTDDTVQEQLNLKADAANIGTIASQDADNVSITGGIIETTTIKKSNITVQAGDTDNDLDIGGTLHIDTTPVGNIGTGEDTLITYTMDANTLNVNGNYLEILAWGITAANANNKRIKLKVGSTILLDTGSVAANNASWFLNVRFIRTSGSSEQAIASILSNAFTNSSTYTDVSEDLTTNLDIFCTGEATTDDDIVQKGLLIKWFK
jgi:hypothetical protein